MTNVVEVKLGEELKVGDIIIAKSAYGENHFGVHMITEEHAVVKYGDVEGKFPLLFDSNFLPVGASKSSVKYRVLRNQKEEIV